jgi:PAS domain S-box-containing protein
VPIFRGGLVVAVLGVGNKSAGYTQKDIDVVSYLADVAWEIAERKQAEEAIRRSEEKYRLIVENTLDIIFTTNANEEYLYVSPSVTDMLGYKPFELIGKPFVSLVHPDDIPLILEEIQRSYNYGYKISRDNEYRLRHASGEWRWVVSRGARVVDANGKFLNFIGVIRDVTERKQAEEALKASEEKYSALVEGNSDGIIILDDRRVVFANKRMTEMTGYYQDEIIGKYFYQLTAPECKVILDKEYQRRQAGKDIFGSIELKIIAKDGKKIEVESRIRRIVYQEKSAAMVILSDITERKKAEEKILASLNEKETLLKEVHHRVKNNMQVISSLLRLQAGRVKDKDSADLLRDSQNRIQSMALVYNKLYLSQDVANINMADYLSELTAGLIRSYASSPNRITVNIVSGGVFLGVDTAIPCGLVVNELVTNSLKYAFPDNKKGQISISLKEDHNHELELIVSDNGIGIPDEFDLVNNSTLGIKLVGNLVQNQLGGKMELVRSNGTAFKIIFHRAKEEK